MTLNYTMIRKCPKRAFSPMDVSQPWLKTTTGKDCFLCIALARTLVTVLRHSCLRGDSGHDTQGVWWFFQTGDSGCVYLFIFIQRLSPSYHHVGWTTYIWVFWCCLSVTRVLLLFDFCLFFFWISCLGYIRVHQLSVTINQYLIYLTCKEERFSWCVPVSQSVTTDIHHDGVSRPEHLVKHSYLLVNQEANGKKNWLWPHSILPGRVLVEHFFPEEALRGPCL